MHLARITIATIAVFTSALVAGAEEHIFELRGPGGYLGNMSASTGDVTTLSITIDGLPLRALNGSFWARQTSNEYRSEKVRGRGTRREIVIDLDQGAVIDVQIDPATELTNYSYPTAISEEFITPVDAILRAMTTELCGSANTIYDGRRIVDLVMSDLQETQAGELTCDGEYRVRLGPGHGSLLNLRTLPVTAHFNQDTRLADEFETQVFGVRLKAVRTSRDE